MPVRRVRVAAVLAAGIGLLATGCVGDSQVPPEAKVSITGAVRAPDGSALVGAPMVLASAISVGESVTGLLTFGLSCAAGQCSGARFDATTSGDGGYRFALTGRQTQTTFANARTQVLTVEGPATEPGGSGASVAASFKVQTTDLVLPPLDLVDPGLSLRAVGRQVALGWASGSPDRVRFGPPSGLATWVQRVDAPVMIDARVLEGTRGQVTLSGGATRSAVGTDVDVRWESPSRSYAASGGPPASRGRPCVAEVTGPEATVQSRAVAGCPVTDGVLGAVARGIATDQFDCLLPGDQPAVVGCTVAVSIGLDGRTTSDLAVVRGCQGACTLQVTGPRGTVTRELAGDYVAVPLPPAAYARARLSGGVAGLREVSIWAQAPPAPTTPSPAATPAPTAPSPSGPAVVVFGTDQVAAAPEERFRSAEWFVVGVGVLLIVTAAAGIGYVGFGPPTGRPSARRTRAG